MLNEIKEVQTYLTNPDIESPRLVVNLLANQFKNQGTLNGLEDVLVLIACHYIYDFKKAVVITNDVKDMTVKILRIWCGFDDMDMDDELQLAKNANEDWFTTYPEADGWLRKYHEKNLKEKGGKWSVYVEKWKEDLENPFAYKAKTPTYESVLAQVVARGPLKNQYLIIKSAYEDALQNDIKTGKDKKPDKKRQPKILKFIAAYKLLQCWHPGQKYVSLPTNRVLGWLGFESDNTSSWYPDLTWKGQPLFIKVGNNDYKKFFVNRDFFSEMDVQLLDEMPENVPEGYCVYCDAGKDKALEEVINI